MLGMAAAKRQKRRLSCFEQVRYPDLEKRPVRLSAPDVGRMNQRCDDRQRFACKPKLCCGLTYHGADGDHFSADS